MSIYLSNYYRKTIRLTPDGFSLYSISSDNEMRMEAYPNTENALITNKAPEFFRFEPDSPRPLDIVVATHPPMLIPDVLYDDRKAKDYLNLQFDITHLGQHFNDSMDRYRVLYFLTQNEYTTFEALNCLPRYRNEASLFYEFLMEQQVSEALFLSVNETFADLMVVGHGTPLLVNRTTHVEPVDILYYTLNSVQQLGLNAPTLYVHYFGKANKKLNELLSKYIKNIILL